MVEAGRALASCFSGPRPHSCHLLPFIPGQPGYEELRHLVKAEISVAIGEGYTTFYTGMAQGWDILCGEAAVELRDKTKEEIRLIAALPFPKQADGWDPHWRTRHHCLLSLCDASVIAAPDTMPKNSQYLERNRYMIDHTSRLICYLVGNPRRGGTAATVRYAQKQLGYQIINLAGRYPSEDI